MLTFFLMSQMNIQRGVCQQKYACGPHLRNHVAPKPRDGFRELREHFVIGQGLETGDFVIKELIGSKVWWRVNGGLKPTLPACRCGR